MEKPQTKAERKAYKALKRAEKLAAKTQKRVEVMSANNEAVNILCVRFGNKYGQEYVVRLRNMVERHMTVPYTFNCLTDDPKPLEGVNSIIQPNAGYPKGWWHKVHMFDPNLPLGGRILYMDLDVVIHKNIDKLVTTYKNDFIGIRDFNRKFHPNYKYLNSSVMSWDAGTQSHIWKEFISNPKQVMRMPGDQDWIWKTSKNILKFWPENWIQSYKWEIRNRQELTLINGVRQFREQKDNITTDPNCCIAVFHGDPNPAQVKDKFVVDNWK